MSNIKNALTRKFGPLPAWGWFAILFVGVWYYRNKVKGGGTVSGTGTGSVAPGGLEALAPGQSYYDPATPGQFFTTPGSGGGSSGGSSGHHRGGKQHHHPQHGNPHHHKTRDKKPKHNGKKLHKGFKLPGQRSKGGTTPHTKRPRRNADRREDRRERKKTKVATPVKARPIGPDPNAPIGRDPNQHSNAPIRRNPNQYSNQPPPKRNQARVAPTRRKR